MKQTVRGSAWESAVSTAVGFLVSWAATPFIFGLFGYEVGVGAAFGVVVIYTVLSFLRGWAVRRYFEWRLHRD